MKKGPGCPRRIYDDDHIHDNPASTTHSPGNDNEKDTITYEKNDEHIDRDNDSAENIYAVTRANSKISKQTRDDGSTMIGSSFEHRLSRKSMKRPLNNPYIEQRNQHKKTQGFFGVVGNNMLGGNITKMATVTTTICGQLKPAPSQNGTTIYNPYKKKQRTAPSKAITGVHEKVGNLGSTTLSSQKKSYMFAISPYNSQSSSKKPPDQPPLVQEDGVNSATNVGSDKIHPNKSLGTRSTEISSQDDGSVSNRITQTPPKKLAIRNPYLKSCGKKNR